MTDSPTPARIIVIGGGIIGCSTAYHLGAKGVDVVLLLERHKLSTGCTFHAAGLVGQLRTTANVTQLLGYSVALYDRLEAETGLATGWKRNGGLRLACTPDRRTEVTARPPPPAPSASRCTSSPRRRPRTSGPSCRVDDVIGAAFLPTDGQASPSTSSRPSPAAPASHQVPIREDTRVTGILTANGRVTGVATDAGPIACEMLVVCAGQWARGARCDGRRHRPRSSASSTST